MTEDMIDRTGMITASTRDEKTWLEITPRGKKVLLENGAVRREHCSRQRGSHKDQGITPTNPT